LARADKVVLALHHAAQTGEIGLDVIRVNAVEAVGNRMIDALGIEFGMKSIPVTGLKPVLALQPMSRANCREETPLTALANRQRPVSKSVKVILRDEKMVPEVALNWWRQAAHLKRRPRVML
jgi:hypothetical protein